MGLEEKIGIVKTDQGIKAGVTYAINFRVDKSELELYEKEIQHSLTQKIIHTILKDAIQYLADHSVQGTLRVYGDNTKIHVNSSISPDDLVLVILHPRKEAELLQKYSFI